MTTQTEYRLDGYRKSYGGIFRITGTFPADNDQQAWRKAELITNEGATYTLARADKQPMETKANGKEIQ